MNPEKALVHEKHEKHEKFVGMPICLHSLDGWRNFQFGVSFVSFVLFVDKRGFLYE